MSVYYTINPAATNFFFFPKEPYSIGSSIADFAFNDWSVDILFKTDLDTAVPTLIVFGNQALGTAVINGDSSYTVGVTVAGQGELVPGGLGDAVISISTIGSGVLLINGDSSQTISVSSTGTAEFSSYPDINGDSSITIDIVSTGNGAHDIHGDNSVSITVDSIGTGSKSINGDSSVAISVSVSSNGVKQISGDSSYTISVTNSGNGVWTGGPDINGDSSITINVTPSGDGRILLPIYGSSAQTITLTSYGTGSAYFFYSDVVGDSSVSISVDTTSEGNSEDIARPLLLDPVLLNTDGILFKILLRVDVDSKEYEIREVESNTSYLKDFRKKKWSNTLALGDFIKKTYDVTSSKSKDIKIAKTVSHRKYGSSEIKLQINISNDYRFIDNEINISKLIEKEVDKAIQEMFSLYELEFE